MFDIDLNGLYEQFGNKYAEVQKAVTRWRTTSEMIQAGGYTFVVTTLPMSEGFWSSKKVLVSLDPLEGVSSPVAFAFKDRWVVAKLLKQNPALLNTVLQLIDSIDFHCLTPKDLDTLKQLERIYSHWKTPKELKESLREHAVTEILQNQNTLKSVFAYMDSINPAHLQKRNKWAMERLSKIANNLQTPRAIKETIFEKVCAICSEASKRTFEGYFAIPKSISGNLKGKGSYSVVLVKTPEEFQKCLRYIDKKQSDFTPKDGFLFYDFPMPNNFPYETNTVVIFNTNLSKTLNHKTLEDINREIVLIEKRLKQYMENGLVQDVIFKQLQNSFVEIQAEANRRLNMLYQARIDADVINVFDMRPIIEDDFWEPITLGGSQQVSNTARLLKEIDKTLPRCKAALEKAQTKITGSKFLRKTHKHTAATRFTQ